MPTRRDFILRGASLAGTAALWPQTAQTADELHLKIAKLVRERLGGQPANIHLLHPTGCRANLIPIITAFKKLTGVSVTLTAGSLDDLESEIRLNLSKGKSAPPIDLALPATFSIPGLVDSNALTDLSELAQQYEPAALKEQMLYTLGNYFGGKFYGYQADGDAYLMFYNRSLPGFKEQAEQYAQQHGRVFNTPDTWDELDRQLKHFHRPNEGSFGGSLYRTRRYVGWEFWSRLHGNGIYPVNAAFEPQFAEPEGVAALESLINASKNLEPGAHKNGLFDNFQSFAKGGKYANLGWGGTQKFILKQGHIPREDLHHGLLPGGTDAQGKPFSTPYFNWGWNYVVLRSSKQTELAYLFSLFATLPSISIRAVQQVEGYFDPHLSSHYNDSNIQQSYGDSFLKAHRHSMVKAIPDFQVRFQERYKRVLSEAVFAADNGHLRPKDALLAAGDQWQRITEEAGRDRQQDHWRNLHERYPTRIKQVLK